MAAPNLPHHTRRVRPRSILPHHAREARGARLPVYVERVGEVYTSAAQVRAELDRVDARWLALKQDIARAVSEWGGTAESLTEFQAFRTSFLDAWARWRDFYSEASADWLAWGSNVTQAESFDAELDTFRARYTTLTGRTPTNPTTSDTGRRHRASDWSGTIRWVAGAAAIAAIAYAVTR